MVAEGEDTMRVAMMGMASPTVTTAEDESLAEAAERAERHLLARSFERARDIALEALDECMSQDAFASSSGVRLSFVLGQALFELGELSDADKKLRRIYGSFTMIPDMVVVLWVTLLATKKERETVKRFTDAFIRVNKGRLGKVAEGTFLVCYVQLVLCDALDDPAKAQEFLDSLELQGAKDNALKQKLQKSIAEYAEQTQQGGSKDQEEKEEALADSGRQDPRSGPTEGTGENKQSSSGRVHGEGKDGESSSDKGVVSEFVHKMKHLETHEMVLAGLAGSTFLYALYSERRAIARSANRVWSRASGAMQSISKFLLEQ